MKPPSAASHPTCKCETCEDQFVPIFSQDKRYKGQIEEYNDSEAAATVERRIGNTTKSYTIIAEKLEEYGNTIMKRWKKRNVIKRKLLLKQVKPDIYPNKRPEWDITLGANRDDVLKRLEGCSYEEKLNVVATYEETFLAPYMDLETLREGKKVSTGVLRGDEKPVEEPPTCWESFVTMKHMLTGLTDPMRLLALMYHRSHSQPSDWVRFDYEQLRSSFHRLQMRVTYNPHCVVLHGEKFGKLVPWEAEAAHRWHNVGYPCAEIILRTQEFLATFMRKTIDLLLENGNEPPIKGNDLWSSIVATEFCDQDLTGTAYCDWPFHAPPTFDINRIVNRCRALFYEASDELQQLHNNPLYLRNLFSQAEASAQYTHLSKTEKQEALVVAPLSVISRYTLWQRIYMGSSGFLQVHEKWRMELQNGKPLPLEYSKALIDFEAVLRQDFSDELLHTDNLLQSDPAFQQHFARTKGEWSVVLDPRDAYRADPLFLNIVLLRDYEKQSSLPTAYHLGHIDELLSQGSTEQKARVDQTLYNHLSDLAALYKLITSIKYYTAHKPLPRRMDQSIDIAFRSGSMRWGAVFRRAFQYCRDSHEVLWDATNAFLRLPLPQRVVFERQYVDRYFDLVHGMSGYWRAISTQMKESFEAAIVDWNLATSPGLVDKLLLRVELSALDKFHTLVEMRKVDALRDLEMRELESQAYAVERQRHVEIPNPRFVPASIEPETTFQPPALKIKVKSRPFLDEPFSPQFSTLSAQEASEDLTQQRRKIGVTHKTMQLFDQVFSSSATAKKSTRWEDFVAAMIDAGCSVTHNGGTTVTFADVQYDLGAIVVHRPHPDPSLDPIMLKAIGKRLSKWFGWNEQTFVEHGKK